MDLIPANIERDFVSLRDAMNRLVEESVLLPSIIGRPPGEGQAWRIPIDLMETDDQLIVKASLPGIKPEDVQVNVQGDTVTIRSQTKEEQKGQQGRYHYQERRQGVCSRSVTLPLSIQPEKVTATFEQGVLTLTLPKAEEAKRRSIQVQVKH